MMVRTCCVLLAAAGCLAADPGETGFASAKIGLGGRVPAMGDAGTATAEAPDAVYWNPACLAGLRHTAEIRFMRNRWLLDDNAGNYLGGALRIARTVVGAGVSLYGSENIGLYGDTPSDDGPLGTFSAHDATFSLAAAHPVTDRLAAGLTLNGLYTKIYTESAAGLSVNAGVRYAAFEDKLRLGAVVRHAGATDRMYRERIVLPVTAAAGASYRFTLGADARLLAAGDLVRVRGGAFRLLSGAELRFRALALRAGYKTSHEYYNDAFTYGCGLSLERFRFDYAFVPFARGLGDTHRFAFTLAL